MSEVTILDLLAIEPALRSIGRDSSVLADIEVGWVVAARTTAPMLPTLRGGELVFFGEAAIGAAAQPWSALVADLERLGAVGVIVPESSPLPPSAHLPVLAYAGATGPAEIEGAINRLLTEFRGELYRAGADLGRVLGVLAAAGADPGRIVREAALALRLPVRFGTASGTLASTDPRTGAVPPAAWVERPIVADLTAAVGWTDPRQTALARLGADRLAEALAGALRRAEAERPRGPARARGIEQFLFADRPADEWRIQSVGPSLGLSPTSEYRVVLSPPGATSDVARAVSHHAIVIEGGTIDGSAVLLLEGRHTQSNWASVAARIADAVGGPPGQNGWAAVSAPAVGFDRLVEAGKEARLVASLLRAGLLSVAVAIYGDARVLGGWQVLLPLRGAPLRAFAADILRDLPAGDRRGDLQRTLEAFLATGGATVEAARVLGIHRNTLAYRLRQIATLTGLDPLDPAARFSLQLAVMAARLDRALG